MTAAMKSLLKNLLLLVLLALPALAAAQTYRAERLPDRFPIYGDKWNAAEKKASDESVTIPNGAEVRLIDTLESKQALVEYEGEKLVVPRLYLYAVDKNQPDPIGVQKRSQSPFAYHSALSRTLYGYGIAWFIAVLLAACTLLSWLDVLPASMRIFVLCGALIAVSLSELLWGIALQDDVKWLIQYEKLGWFTTLLNILGYFGLIVWQVWMIKRTQSLICDEANVDPDEVKLRWAVLLPVPLLLVGLIAAALLKSRTGISEEAAAIGLLLLILALEGYYIRRYYTRLGATLGTAYLLLFLAILFSTIVLIPVTVMLGVFILCVLLFIGAIVMFGAWIFGSHVEKIDGKYYKVDNF